VGKIDKKCFCPNNNRSLTRLSQISTTLRTFSGNSTFEPRNTNVTLLSLNIFEVRLSKLSEDFTYYLEEILRFLHLVTRITVVVVSGKEFFSSSI